MKQELGRQQPGILVLQDGEGVKTMLVMRFDWRIEWIEKQPL